MIAMEDVQQRILTILDQNSVIRDTRDLILPGKVESASTQEEQLIIQGALNSLLSKEVCVPFKHFLFKS